MVATSFANLTSCLLLVTLTSLGGFGHLLHNGNCSGEHGVANGKHESQHSCCLHDHDQSVPPAPNEPAQDEDSGEHGQCTICVHLSLCSEPPALFEVPDVVDALRIENPRSDLFVYPARSLFVWQRGPPA